ncbi:MAG: hypothetical protein BWK80_57990 [Desulfobacteraceae bacterium IS3]|nr:MAG: hypothetical protein BWK80_57990 [Desulfobacteraceae bacterium IS3]
MRLDPNPIYRKIIIPWYDSRTVCFIMIALMAAVFLFSLTGISAAHETLEYREHIWVPLLIAFMSAGVILSTVIRLIKRYAAQHKE